MEHGLALGWRPLAENPECQVVMVAVTQPWRPEVRFHTMAGMSGLEACTYIRQSSDAAIIMLTASGDERDKIRALDSGADDYLTKPFGVGELMARVRALLRRVNPEAARGGQPDQVQVGPISMDFPRRLVAVRGEPVKLTPTEYALLEQFVRRPEQVLSHRELLSRVWGAEYRDDVDRAHVR